MDRRLVTERFRRFYGAGPLHLLALTASLLVAGAAVAGWFDNQGSITERILIWFVGAIIGHDLVLVPLYSLLDRIAYGVTPGRSKPREGSPPQRSPGWVYVRIPALLTGLLALVFFPEVLRLGNQTFRTASGMTQDVYLSRFLLTCGLLFGGSGIAYAVSLRQAHRAGAALAEKPPDAVVAEEPPDAAVAEQPPDAAVAEQPPDAAVAEQPPDPGVAETAGPAGRGAESGTLRPDSPGP